MCPGLAPSDIVDSLMSLWQHQASADAVSAAGDARHCAPSASDPGKMSRYLANLV